jgi:folylpolyglutamate synthase
VAVRERIRINSEPISEEQFTKYFFEVWDALESTARQEGIDPALKPTYFRYLTLMSFHIFMREGVDAVVYEVGVGGELDSTNVIKRPAVTGITTLGIDHVDALGDTIDKIAWHKAGIFKSGSPAFSVQQLPEAIKVLEERAKAKEVSLTIIEDNPALAHVAINQPRISRGRMPR